MFSVTYNTELYSTNSRYKVGMIAHFLFKFLKKSEICGITWPHTLLILKYQKTHVLLCKCFSLQQPRTFILRSELYLFMYLQYVLIILYQHRDDSSVLLLHQVTDDFIVEELHWLPLKHSKRK